jgi:hypothetical protein
MQLPTDPLAGPLLSVDPAKLREAAGKMNFASRDFAGTTCESNEWTRSQAFLQVLNAVGQGAFLQATQVNAGVVESAFGRHTQRMEEALPDRIRNVQIQQLLLSILLFLIRQQCRW